jgi:recombination protein RecT
MTTQNTQVATQELSQSERFSKMVIKEFSSNNGSVALTNFQKRLVQNYFISTDMALKKAEENRMKKQEQYRDTVPVIWQNVNMEALAVNVVSCARIGYDPALPNHINMVPYKNNTTQKYDVGFVPGYRGKELMATKYGLNIPADVVVELVYSTDVFKVIKKDLNNSVESYHFEVVAPFERGEIIGGFYYHVFEDKTRNKLMFYSKHEIDKRKPAYASAEFWGGVKDKWVKDPATGKNKKEGTEVIEGWYAEMAWKTLCRAAYGAITIDSQKIDDDYIRLTEIESKVDSLAGADKDADSRNDAVNKQPANVVTEDVAFEDVTKQGEPAQSPATQQTNEQPATNAELFTEQPATSKGPNF